MNEYVLRNEDQLSRFKAYLDKFDLPIQVKISKAHTPKTTKQVRYAHSLCGALAVYAQITPKAAKIDTKASFGTVIVCMSSVTGDRTARLKSFEHYSRDEMSAFVNGMHAHLDEKQIPYVRAQE